MTRPLRILLSLLAVLGLAVAVGACGESSGGSGSDSGSGQSAAPKPSGGGSGQLSASEKQANQIKPVPGSENTKITVGSKNFTEQYILGEIYAQALQAAGYDVKKELNLGSEVVAHKSLKQGEIDAYPEYTGTALTSFFDVDVANVPKEAAQAYEQAKAAYAKEGITALAPTPFENTYRLGMTKKRAQEIGNPQKISDLQGKAQGLVVNGFPECRQRIDCLLGVKKAYGLDFKKFLPGENKYQVLDNGNADVAFIFTTDGNLASGKYQVLDDDKNVFPPYNITFTVRDQMAQKMGQPGQDVIRNVQKFMTQDVLQELNARVDLEKKEPEKVASEYLKAYGFTS